MRGRARLCPRGYGLRVDGVRLRGQIVPAGEGIRVVKLMVLHFGSLSKQPKVFLRSKIGGDIAQDFLEQPKQSRYFRDIEESFKWAASHLLGIQNLCLAKLWPPPNKDVTDADLDLRRMLEHISTDFFYNMTHSPGHRGGGYNCRLEKNKQ